MVGNFRQNMNEYFRANIVAYFFMILIFVIGVAVGALAVKALPEDQKLELIGYLKVFFQGLVQSPGVVDTPALFSTVALSSVKTIGLIWLLGFTVVGIPFVLFIIFTRGFVIGFTVGFLINEYIMKGLAFALASVLPHNFFAVPALLAAGVAATSFSMMLVRRKQRAKVNILYESVGYTVFCLLMLALMLAAAVIEVYISPVFMKLVAGLLLKQ
ncbi:stage II sporulation protein M [Anaeroselena agilis]|uniref:Stage II sporulation protein M n=1 Tax=Anaeroselena agilis TaxID=3063788 RepID=A0ABU3NWA6_9FIRM|nr:stage II sporulation protein M [Selenomonadales bacterium 4137-cl]